MNLFNDANSYRGIVTAVTLPKLARKLDPFRAGGMSGAAFIDNGMEDYALDMEWSIGGMDELVLTQWRASNIPLRFTGSYQRDDTGEEIAVEIEVRGKMYCSLCQTAPHATISRYVSKEPKESHHQCQNINCSCTFKTHEAFTGLIISLGQINKVPLYTGPQQQPSLLH